MKMAILGDGTTLIIVGLDKYNDPIDTDGKLFGPKSGRDIEKFDTRTDFDPSDGEAIIIEPTNLEIV
jgi:hypothetical protein